MMAVDRSLSDCGLVVIHWETPTLVLRAAIIPRTSSVMSFLTLLHYNMGTQDASMRSEQVCSAYSHVQ